jgi:hypothetical protein
MKLKSAVSVTVNHRRWRQVPTLANSGPRDRHYVIKTVGEKTTVQFGDGIHGAVPLVGSTVQATYRTGTGKGSSANPSVVTVTYRTAAKPTRDQQLWVAIRNRTNISFLSYK